MKLTRRGKIVAWIVGLLAFYFLYWLLNHIWWTDNGYCLGSMTKCLGL